jgi:hypothetical protein
MINLFQDYLDNPQQFHAVKDLCTNWLRWVSITGQHHDTDSFVDLVKRIEAFPATECACEGLFCQLRNLVGDFRHQMSDLWLSICCWSKQESYSPTLRRSKRVLRVSRKCNQTPAQTKRPPSTSE